MYTEEKISTIKKEGEKTEGKSKKRIVLRGIAFIVAISLLLSLACCNNKIFGANKQEKKTETTLTSEEVDNIVRNASNEISGELSTYINDYFEENNITALSDDDINQMAELITDGIVNNYSLTDEDIINIKHEVLNQLLQTFEVSSTTEVSYLSDEVKNYVTNTVVQNILSSSQINNNTATGSENADAIEELKNTTETINNSVSDTITEISSAKEELSATKKEIATTAADLQEQSDALDERITTAQENCNSLQERLTELSDEFATMDSSNQTDLANMAQEIVQLQNDIKSASDELSSLQTEKEELVTAISANRSDIDSISQNISTVSDSISLNTSLISGLTDSKVSVSDLNAYMLELCYPVGSIYMSTQDVSPATFLGGTWERITDTTLVGAGNQYAVGSTGGSSSATLSAENIPSLSVTGNTTAQNGVATSSNGAYDGTITSSGTYTGGTYSTSANGEHNHEFATGGSALVVDSNTSNPAMGYSYGFANATNGLPGTIWFDNHTKNNSSIAGSGNHNHSVSVPSQTITSKGSLSIGNHSHTLDIPSLYVNAYYTNDSVSAFSVQDPYTAVYMWKRIS